MLATPVHSCCLHHFIHLVAGQVANETGECRVPTDPDIKVLGFRLGLYFQILSTVLMATVCRREALDNVIPTFFFFAAFLAAVIFSIMTQSLPPGAIIACEWCPVLSGVALFPVWQTDFTDTHPTIRNISGFIGII